MLCKDEMVGVAFLEVLLVGIAFLEVLLVGVAFLGVRFEGVAFIGLLFFQSQYFLEHILRLRPILSFGLDNEGCFSMSVGLGVTRSILTRSTLTRSTCHKINSIL